MSKDSIRKIFPLVFIMPIACNLLAVLAQLFTYPLFLTHAEDLHILYIIKEANYIGIVVLFLFGLFAAMFFLRPCLDYVYFGAGEEALERARPRVLGIPIVLPLIGAACWIMYMPVYFVGAAVKDVPLESRATTIFIVDKFLTAGLNFVFSYYSLELLSRKSLVPFFFPDGNFATCCKGYVATIRQRVYILHFSVAIFPMYLLYCILLGMRQRGELTADLNPVVSIMLGTLIIGSLIALMFSNLMNRPLVDMRKAVEKIQSGDLEARAKVESNDEIGTLGAAINAMAAGLKEKEFIKDTFGKIVDPAVRDFLLKGNVALGGDSREMTALFCDIRGFTTLAEKMRPDVVVEMLNAYFNAINECILSEKGIINKYIGDAVMAIFGAPAPLENHAAAAVRAAVKMENALTELNKSFRAKNLPELKIGVGIHTGTALTGNIGSGSRMEYTAIGDAVNIASRTQDLCKELSIKLLFTKATADKLGTEFDVRFVDRITFRGKSEPVALYTLNNGD